MTLVRRIIGLCLLVVMFLAVGGCANKGVTPLPEPVKQPGVHDTAAKEKAVMDNYNVLLQKKDATLPDIIAYVDENIPSVSQTNASAMIVGLETVQKEKLPKLQDQFGDSEAVQKALVKSYRNGLTRQAIDSIASKEAKDLLLEVQGSGFKIETAEGMYFPVIDYSAYKRYRNAVTPDMAAYIDIMAVESDITPIKDAALRISWREIIKRAQEQERFVKDHVTFVKVQDMRQLLKRYTVFAMYGANNTPLFSYETKQMVSEAKKVYLETAFDANMGSFSKVMNEYLIVLNKNDYKLSEEVQEYRNKAIEEMR